MPNLSSPEALTPFDCARLANLPKPEQCNVIEQGLSHFSYCLCTGQQSWFLRIYHEQHKPWLNREHELAMMHEAASRQFSPKLLFVDPQQRFFISEYLVEQESSKISLTQLQELILQVSQMPIGIQMSPAQRLFHYASQARVQLQNFNSEALKPAIYRELNLVIEQAEHAIAELTKQQWPVVPSFLDWHRGNLLMLPTKAYLIDFEYLVLSELPLELASLKLSELVADSDWPVLKAYVEQLHNTSVSELDVHWAERLFLALCYCWYWAVSPNKALAPTRELLQRLKLENLCQLM